MSERIKEQIEISAMTLLKTATDDYSSRILADVKEDVFSDVQECSAIAEDGSFTDGDVALALGRAIYRRIGSAT